MEAWGTFAIAELSGGHDGEEEFCLLPISERILAGVDKVNRYHVISQFRGDYLFIDSILENRSISPSFYDGLKAQEVIDAAKESHKTCRWVSLRSRSLPH